MKKWKYHFPRPGIEPSPLDSVLDSTASLQKPSCTVGQYKCIIYLYPVTFSSSKLKFIPEFLGVQESREMRLSEFYVHVWVIYDVRQNVTDKTKKKNNIFSERGSNPVRWTQSPTLYRIAIKDGLYRKAVHVYRIPIPSDISIVITLLGKSWVFSFFLGLWFVYFLSWMVCSSSWCHW